MWESHIRVCAVLLFLILPIALADYALLKGKSGGWISLDFSGIVTGAYVIVLALHIAISTLALRLIPSQGMWVVHSISAAIAFVLFCAGAYGYFTWNDHRDRKQYETSRAARAILFDVLTLNEWRYSPDRQNATEIIVSVTVRESGRFSCNASAYEEGENGEMVFYGDHVQQRMVEPGEHFTHVIPLKWVKAGLPEQVEITLYLFADSIGSAGKDVIKIFTAQPAREDDGHYFYGVLPPPSREHK